MPATISPLFSRQMLFRDFIRICLFSISAKEQIEVRHAWDNLQEDVLLAYLGTPINEARVAIEVCRKRLGSGAPQGEVIVPMGATLESAKPPIVEQQRKEALEATSKLLSFIL